MRKKQHEKIAQKKTTFYLYIFRKFTIIRTAVIGLPSNQKEKGKKCHYHLETQICSNFIENL
jgi:hypothetical protein